MNTGHLAQHNSSTALPASAQPHADQINHHVQDYLRGTRHAGRISSVYRHEDGIGGVVRLAASDGGTRAVVASGPHRITRCFTPGWR